jgi:hypothetical protein
MPTGSRKFHTRTCLPVNRRTRRTTPRVNLSVPSNTRPKKPMQLRQSVTWAATELLVQKLRAGTFSRCYWTMTLGLSTAASLKKFFEGAERMGYTPQVPSRLERGSRRAASRSSLGALDTLSEWQSVLSTRQVRARSIAEN